MKKTIGVILNGHRPLHIGHVYMIDFARAFVDELHIGVCTLSSESIPANLRYEWTKEQFPMCSVQLCHDMPDYFNLDYNDPVLWAKTVKEYMKIDKLDYIFASEDYGYTIAKELGIKYIPIDHNRNSIKISASMIRNNPMINWEYLPPVVRPYYVKRICIYGEDKNLNNKVSNYLSNRYNTVLVNEYIGNYFLNFEEDLKCQVALEHSLAKQSNKVMFCLSSPLLIRVLNSNVNSDLLDIFVEGMTYDIHFVLNSYDLYKKILAFDNGKNNIIHIRESEINIIQQICMKVDNIISGNITV